MHGFQELTGDGVPGRGSDNGIDSALWAKRSSADARNPVGPFSDCGGRISPKAVEAAASLAAENLLAVVR